MELNSCLYETDIMHLRTRPKRHKLAHKIFMFYLDLDELDVIAEKLHLISRNKFNVYNFCDDDHFDFDGRTIKEKVLNFLSGHNVRDRVCKIMLLTNLRTFGYNFNPVSFYFCFDKDNSPLCVVPEIGNTFREIKPFFIGKDSFKDGKFISQQKKFFYISPFIDLDIPLDFKLSVPQERLRIQIDDFDEKGKFLYATMSGKKIELTNWNLFIYSLRFPLITLKIIFLIHFHAFLLWLKKIPYYEKESNPHLQKEVYRVWHKSKAKPKTVHTPKEA